MIQALAVSGHGACPSKRLSIHWVVDLCVLGGRGSACFKLGLRMVMGRCPYKGKTIDVGKEVMHVLQSLLVAREEVFHRRLAQGMDMIARHVEELMQR